MRHGANQALTFRRLAARAGYVRCCPGFIKEDEAVCIQRQLQRCPGLAGLDYVVALLLLGLEVFFLASGPAGPRPST